MVAKGTVIFSSALFGLISCLFGVFLSLLFAVAMFHIGEAFIGIVAVPVLIVSLLGLYMLYGWFTEDV